MSRAGIRPDISERVLGHVIKGVEGIYDRHAYTEEKAHALKSSCGLDREDRQPAGQARWSRSERPSYSFGIAQKIVPGMSCLT